MTEKTRTIFVCQQCGKESPKWLGRCPDCREWNSFVEQKPLSAASRKRATAGPPQELSAVSEVAGERLKLTIGEFNRVLGGGIVAGSLVLIGGEPGIGKSTLLLQVAAQATGGLSVAYVSGEETARQIKLRAKRLGISGEGLFLLAETDLEVIINQLDNLKPGLVVVDSIQTVYAPQTGTSPGSVPQVRECTIRLMNWAKAAGVPVLISGHVTKDGTIAGPRVLEHIVDTVLYLEGEQFSSYRLLRGVKNRFGSTNEIGIFEMKAEGLMEVANPSQMFLSRRPEEAVASAVAPTIEGSRPLLVEIQALTNTTSFGLPRRTANGLDYNRLLVIAAVLSRRVGLKLGNQDIIVSAAGGIKVNEPAADLAIALAIASSFRNMPIRPKLAAVGEIGLSGELRTVSQLERRCAEAARLGFKYCLVPKNGDEVKVTGIKLIAVANLKEAVKEGLAGSQDDK